MTLEPGTVLDWVPIFPLPETVLFPSSLLPLHIFEPRYLELVSDALEGSLHLGIALLQPGWEEHYYGTPKVHQIFGLGEIVKVQELPNGRRNILLKGVARMQIEEELRVPSSYRQVRAEVLGSRRAIQGEADLQRSLATLRQLFTTVAQRVEGLDFEFLQALFSSDSGPSSVIDAMAALIPLGPRSRQTLLETLDLGERAAGLCQLLTDLVEREFPEGLSALQGNLPPGGEPGES